LVMSQRTLSAEKLKEIQGLASAWEKSSLAASSANPAAAPISTLWRWSTRPTPSHRSSPAPIAADLCPVAFADRPLTVQGGHQLNLHEPIGHCPDCRRDFFPLRLCLRLDNHHDSLQLRAALLSEDDRLERFFAQRPGNPYRRRQAA
jgi:hypothetical protein